MSAIDVVSRALELPEAERAALAHRLLLSLESDPADSDHEAAWAREIETRLDKIAQGNFAARDWRDAVADARQALKKENAP